MFTNRQQEIEIIKNAPFSFYPERISSGTSTHHSMEATEDHELPVVGTFIHNHILPGFRYRVRLIGTDEYLFDGKALKLDSIGQGYGKRLTFESDDILENDNFFWSDSNDAGFAFSVQLLFPGEVFEVHDGHDVRVGSFSLESVNEKQEVTGVTYEENLVNVHAKVNFSGKLWLFSQSSIPAPLCEKEIVVLGSGNAIVNRLSSTVKLLETDRTQAQSRILNLLNAQLFIKHVK